MQVKSVHETFTAALDALVVSTNEAPALIRELSNASLSQIRPAERKNEQALGYVLLTR